MSIFYLSYTFTKIISLCKHKSKSKPPPHRIMHFYMNPKFPFQELQKLPLVTIIDMATTRSNVQFHKFENGPKTFHYRMARTTKVTIGNNSFESSLRTRKPAFGDVIPQNIISNKVFLAHSIQLSNACGNKITKDLLSTSVLWVVSPIRLIYNHFPFILYLNGNLNKSIKKMHTQIYTEGETSNIFTVHLNPTFFLFLVQ